MSIISIPNIFTVGATIVASQHNSNFSTIASDYNGNITTANIAANASIADTQLAQITTAGKLSGAAFTSLTSVPAGAGVLPIANLASGSATGSKYIRDDGTLQVTGFGSWTDISANFGSSTLVSTDGFLVLKGPLGSSSTITVKTDTSNPPTTVRIVYTSTAASNNSGMCPVKKGDRYLISATSANPDSGYFISMGT